VAKVSTDSALTQPKLNGKSRRAGIRSRGRVVWVRTKAGQPTVGRGHVSERRIFGGGAAVGVGGGSGSGSGAEVVVDVVW